MSPIIVSAHNPMTGPRHLGHYVSTMIDWVELQRENELIIIIDDLIACLLYPSARKSITERSFQVAREFIATGIDFQSNSMVLTSMIPEVFELSFFAGMAIDQHWCMKLYNESFAGLLDSYQRNELGLPRNASIAEVTYPQLNLATLVLGLRAAAFQGGEEMRGYLGIMHAIAEGLGQTGGFKAPSFMPGRSTFLVGTDGHHMATENAVYISDSETDIDKSLQEVVSIEILRAWLVALGKKDLAAKLPRDESKRLDAAKMTAELLSAELERFRTSKITKGEIAEVLQVSSIRVREKVLTCLKQVKAGFGIPGFVQ